MKRNTLRFLMALPFLSCVSRAVAYADTIDFTLTNTTQTVNPGGALSFSATVSAAQGNTGPVYLNGDTYTFSAPAALLLDDTPFFLNFPFFLNSGDSDTAVLFTISVPLGTAGGSYTGGFTLLGGEDPDAQELLGSDPFTVDVTTVTAVTPEPSSWLLCASGILGLSVVLRKRLFKRLDRIA